MCPSLIEIESKTAEKNSEQTNRQTDKQTDRHYENNGHLAVNQLIKFINQTMTSTAWHTLCKRGICYGNAVCLRVTLVSPDTITP